MIKNISVTSKTEIVKHPHPIATAIQLPSVMINIKPVPAIENTATAQNIAPSVHRIHLNICEAIVLVSVLVSEYNDRSSAPCQHLFYVGG